MSMNMPPAVYWYKNQITVTFHSDVSVGEVTDTATLLKKVDDHRKELNSLLEGFTLQVPDNTMPPQQSSSMNMSSGSTPADSGDLNGIIVYPSPFQEPPPGGIFTPKNDLIVFYSIGTQPPPTTPSPPTPTQGGDGGTGGMSGMTGMGGMGGDNTQESTIQVLKQLYAKKGSIETSFDAMPYWFHAGTGDPTHGCPITPPFPAGGYSKAGQWKFMSPQGANTTGTGVTVFILDAFPTADQITAAANNPACDNPLLQEMAHGMVSVATTNPALETRATPPAITLNRIDDSTMPQDVTTGKDIYGNLAGFSLIDHGLTIAGIIRDLAPEANIECIRVLNDHGVGDVQTLIKALKYIQFRMARDLHNKPVVINLSLVIGPPEGDRVRLQLDDDAILKQTLAGLPGIIQSLTNAGAIVVASAGNDTDPRDPMHPAGTRLGPRYPAAFAYDPDLNSATAASIIPVGAINGQGEVASYSNYPGPDGIAAYGGEIPTPYPPVHDPNTITQIDPMVPLDAVRGVYSSATYPALSMDDKYPMSSGQPSGYPEYSAPDASAWTCWAGTSFATPVISALAACLLEGQKVPYTINVRQMLKDSPATQQVMWTELVSASPVAGPAIMVMQEFKLNRGNMPVR
ncbi:MAG TPA: S8 family serine peptidase [Ktedonobacteraceae bacterium]|nr:S8 family serine peptidase [Ktedonobacteraceae bacterium]